LLCLIKGLADQINFKDEEDESRKTTFEATICHGKDFNLVIQEHTTPVVEGAIAAMKVSVSIYQMGTTENHVWAVFRRTEGGDALLLRKLFEKIAES
jgi:hypothetical protein